VLYPPGLREYLSKFFLCDGAYHTLFIEQNASVARLYEGDTGNPESRGERSVSIRFDGSKEKISGYICFGETCG
jgi:hypothetical protein